MSRAEESVHNDKIKLETPKINAIEINEKHREMRLEVAIPTRNILGDSIPKLHGKWTKILESKVIRRANPTKMVNREVCRPPPKPPYILNINGEVIGIIENVVQKSSPP